MDTTDSSDLTMETEKPSSLSQGVQGLARSMSEACENSPSCDLSPITETNARRIVRSAMAEPIMVLHISKFYF